ncbi:DUF7706 family protein [Klebsiella pneumoniae]
MLFIQQSPVDDDEAYVIKDAVDKLQRAMAEEGFSPR